MRTLLIDALRSRLMRKALQGLTGVCVLVLALAMALRAEAQQTATASAPARVSVNVPQAQDGGPATLEIVVSAFRRPGGGNIGGVVRLKRSGGGAVEVGRFTIFPAQSFTATTSGEEQRYRFDITSALKQLNLVAGAAEVEVTLVDRSSGAVPAGTELQLGHAQIARR